MNRKDEVLAKVTMVMVKGKGLSMRSDDIMTSVVPCKILLAITAKWRSCSVAGQATFGANTLIARGVLLAISLVVLNDAKTVEASPIDNLEPGVRAMGMASAFVAQADDSSALWYNPAGLARFASHEKPALEYALSYGQLKADVDDKAFEADQLGLIAARGFHKTALGIGVYDTRHFRLYLPDADGNRSEQLTMDSYDINLSMARAWGNFLLGGSGLIVILSAGEDTPYKNNEDVKFAWQLGIQYRLLNHYFDFLNQSVHVEFDLGALYRPEITAKPFSQLTSSSSLPDKNTQLTVHPQNTASGFHLGLGWISESLVWRLHMNMQVDRSLYQDMAVYLVPESAGEDVKLSRRATGAELQLSSGDANWALSFRAGVAEQTGNFSEFDEQIRTAGVGLSVGNSSLELALRQIHPDESSPGDDNELVALSISALW